MIKTKKLTVTDRKELVRITKISLEGKFFTIIREIINYWNEKINIEYTTKKSVKLYVNTNLYTNSSYDWELKTGCIIFDIGYKISEHCYYDVFNFSFDLKSFDIKSLSYSFINDIFGHSYSFTKESLDKHKKTIENFYILGDKFDKAFLELQKEFKERVDKEIFFIDFNTITLNNIEEIVKNIADFEGKI